jgi:putative transposase
VNALQNKFTVSERTACRVIDQPHSSRRYASEPRVDEPALVKRMLERAREHRRIAALLRREYPLPKRHPCGP